jgi:ABC-2 type transport system permease protein
MLRNAFLATLRETRRSLAWWSLGLVGLTAMITAVYPSVRDNPQLNQLSQDYPEALKAFLAFGGQVDYVSAAGYLGTELFAFMVPLLLIVAAVGAGARAIAGEEEKGTLELLLANPISRRRLVLEKLGALAAELVALGAVLWAALAVAVRAAGMDVSLDHLTAATTDAVLLALGFGSIALLVGSATGRRGLAIGVTAAAAVAAYIISSLAALVDFLELARKASPFYHYAIADPLRQGLSAEHALFLVAVVAVAAVLAPFALERRDLRS